MEGKFLLRRCQDQVLMSAEIALERRTARLRMSSTPRGTSSSGFPRTSVMLRLQPKVSQQAQSNVAPFPHSLQDLTPLQGQSLYQQLQLPLPTNPSKVSITLFIYGGSTAMGIAGLQYAKVSGARVITTSSPHNAEYLYSLGADHVLDYSSSTLVDEVKGIMKGEPLTRAWDCRPSEESGRTCAKVLAKAGSRYVTLLPHTQELVKEIIPSVETFFTAAYTVFGEPWFFLGYHDAVPEDHEFMKAFVHIAEDLMREGKVKAPRMFLNRGGKGLKGVLDGIQEMVEGKVSGGKLVYTRE